MPGIYAFGTALVTARKVCRCRIGRSAGLLCVHGMGCASSVQKPPGNSSAASKGVTGTAYKKTYNSYDEWQRKNAEKRLAEAMASDPVRSQLQALYTRLDTDGDGKLTADEFSAGLTGEEELMTTHFGDVTQESMRAVFESLDEDGNGSLSWEEFSKGSVRLSADDS